MRAHFGLPSVETDEMEGKPPITVKFEIPYFTVSGIQVRVRLCMCVCMCSHSHSLSLLLLSCHSVDVLFKIESDKCMIRPATHVSANLKFVCVRKVRYMKIIEKSGYQALPWVRYITQSGGERSACVI